MKQTDIFDYFIFGFNYAIIKRTGLTGVRKAEALDYLDEFFSYLDSLDLQITKLVADDLRRITETIRSGTSDSTVSQDVANEIKSETIKIDPGLDAELQIKKAYVLTKKRYALDALLSNCGELLGTGVFSMLTDNTKKDYQLACTQVALSQPTAAAFHLMRALEGQVKVLYFAFKKTSRLEKPLWGQMIAQLRTKRAPKPSEKLLDHLDGMRVHFRNPTQHPEAFYTIDEIQDLLNQTITAINMIAAELPKK